MNSADLKKNILLIDDDAVAHYVVKRMADHAGFNWDLRSFLNPFDALNSLVDQSWQPDLAIIDHHLPELTGVSFAELLRQQGYDFPWIWISSGLEKPHFGDFFAPEACITKPLMPESISLCDSLASRMFQLRLQG